MISWNWLRKKRDDYRAAYEAGRPKRDAGLDERALAYHEATPAGKVATLITKPLATIDDLSLAYSPGVAAASRAIAADPDAAARLTARANTVAVITNGTAVLGLGDIGPLAAKPVMEGKAALFKRFADIDAVSLEINERDPKKFAEIVIALEPSFGGINLEDIAAPGCFEIEEICLANMNIPVFHDDQHGTAICILAALENALLLTGRDITTIKLVCIGAGAAALASLELLVGAGLPRENIIVCDRSGVIHQGRRAGMNERKARFATRWKVRTLEAALKGADVFIGLSGPAVLDPAFVKEMASEPVIFALANPSPEIWPADVFSVAPDAIVATGRSDLPNQINNAICFPFLFRGALDAGAKQITERMRLAAARAIAEVARAGPDEALLAIYSEEELRFGKASLLPKLFDPRLKTHVSRAVKQAV